MQQHFLWAGQKSHLYKKHPPLQVEHKKKSTVELLPDKKLA
jgi:hypothetical protein